MQTTTNLNLGPPARQDDSCCVLDNHPRKKKGHSWSWRSRRGSVDETQTEAGTLPRGWRQKKQNSLVDYSDPLRTMCTLEKQDNESFGFEIQTYGLQPSHTSTVEMCTFICLVHKDSIADCAGLTSGDVILTVNGWSIEGSPHQQVVDAVRQSTNILKIETTFGTIMKRIELEKKRNLMKKSLREKWEELQTLVLQEARLTHDSTDSTPTPSTDSLVSPDGFGGGGGGGPGGPRDSSYWSAASEEDGDQASVFFGDAGFSQSPSPVSGAPGGDSDDCFFSQGFEDRLRGIQEESRRNPGGIQEESRRKLKSSGSFCVRRVVDRTTSSSGGSSSSSSPSYWDGDDRGASSAFGTLPRKGRKGGSVRRHLLKLMPGFSRSLDQDVVEELDPDGPCRLDRVFSGGRYQQKKATKSCS
ncbi:unnamed protein product [Boreogadus saida]